MSFRSFVRGENSIDIDEIKEGLREHYKLDSIEIEVLKADNWLSVPLVVNREYFVKVISPQNTLTHAFFTSMRNIGVTMSGNGPFFETFESPYEMAKHEIDVTRSIRELGIHAPRPIEVIEVGENALVVFEYISDYKTLDETELTLDLIHKIFRNLRHLHENGFAHGDFSLENVLVVDDEIYFIDSTKIKPEGRKDAVAYDLACALGALAWHIGEKEVVGIASEYYSPDELGHAVDFLILARFRPGIEESFSIIDLRTHLLNASKKI